MVDTSSVSTQTKDGGFGAADRDAHYNQWSLTGAGVLALQTLAKGKTGIHQRKSIDFLHRFLEAEPLDWNKNCNPLLLVLLHPDLLPGWW
jgi:hypothetical protein